jgi:CheY-like chemotaxis protein
MRILLVEDNELNRDMLTRRLARRSFEVVTAPDGAEALRQARAIQPDLVLMDVSLPVMDGLQATRALKSDPSTCAIPVIALTAHALAEDRDLCLQAGCADFQSKPIDFERLVQAISRFMPPETPA